MVLSGFRSRGAGFWATSNPTWTVCLPVSIPTVISKSSSTLDKIGSRSWNFLSPGDLASAQVGRSTVMSKESYDSLKGETSSIVKVERKSELQLCVLTDDDISLWPRINSGSPQSCVWSLTHGVDALLGTLFQLFSQLGLQTAVTWEFPVLFKSGCRFRPSWLYIHYIYTTYIYTHTIIWYLHYICVYTYIHMVIYTLYMTSLMFLFLFFQWLHVEIKLNNLQLKIEIVYLCARRGFFLLTNLSDLKWK